MVSSAAAVMARWTGRPTLPDLLTNRYIVDILSFSAILYQYHSFNTSQPSETTSAATSTDTLTVESSSLTTMELFHYHYRVTRIFHHRDFFIHYCGDISINYYD